MVAEIIDPSESCRKLRRVTFTIDFADGSLKSKLIIFAQDRGVKWMNSPGRGSGPCRLVCGLALLNQFVSVTPSLLPGGFRAEIGQPLK